MAFGNQFHMPGSYHLEGPGASTTLNANMFRPPVSPSTSTYNLTKSTGSLLSDTSMATNGTNPAPKLGRKRTHDESNARGLSKLNREISYDTPMDGDSTRGEHRYTLAGQIETPGAQVTPQDGGLEDSRYSDVDYRRALGSTRAQDDDNTPNMMGLVVHPETGEPLTPRTAGWTSFAFQAIGGVVGKVWEFCRGGAGAFRGFQAGGGKAYEFNGQSVSTLQADLNPPAVPTPQETPNSAYPSSAETGFYTPNDYFSDPQKRDREQQQQPAYVYEENPFAKMMEVQQQEVRPAAQMENPFARMEVQQDDIKPAAQMKNPFVRREEKEPSPETTPERPAAKRRQTGFRQEDDELRRNWVVVEEEEQPSPAPSNAPTRPSLDAKRPSASRIPAATNRFSTPSRPQQSRFGAAAASNRRISAPSPRFTGSAERSNIPTRASSRLSVASPSASYAGGYAGSPTLSAKEPASFASPRSPSQASVSSNPFTPNGSRIPQPRSVLGPNPFANTRTSSPIQPPRISPSRPSSRQSGIPSPLHQNLTSKIATPNGHRKSFSSGSATSARGRHSIGYEDLQTSPRLDDEGRQLATKRYVVQKKNDSRLDRLNAELQGLIRQGQQALGTTYDVEMDEGWEEDA